MIINVSKTHTILKLKAVSAESCVLFLKNNLLKSVNFSLISFFIDVFKKKIPNRKPTKVIIRLITKFG